MSNKKPKNIPYRRKRSGKTNYKKRLHLLLSQKHQLVVRFTNQKIIAQIIDFNPKGDVVLIGLDSTRLQKHGWKYSLKNFPAAYLTGYLLGKQALKKDVNEAILNLGFKSPTKGNKIYACLKGAVDAGLQIAHSEEILPAEEKISGQHIQEYAAKLKDNQEAYQKKFSKYLKNSLDPTKIVETFQKTKQQIENA